VKATIRRSGGLAGLQQHLVSFDTQQLPPGAARSLSSHLQQLTTLLAAGEPEVGADLLKYELEISGEPGQPEKVLTVIDTADPEDPRIGHVSAILDLAGRPAGLPGRA